MPRKMKLPTGNGNRSDLPGAGQKIPTGLPYGQAQTLQQQMAAGPTIQPTQAPRPGPPSAPAVGPPAAPQAGPEMFNGVSVDALQGMSQVQPMETPFNAPTTRPGEPVTAGLPIGAGPGPEALPSFARDTSKDVFYALAQATGDDSYIRMAGQFK